MKYTIGNYEVNITVKNTITDKPDTKSFMNLVSIWAGESAKYNESIYCNALANSYRKQCDEIYQQLKKQGTYKNL